jgi:5-methylcytosine-specific restriction endonuclease McrA
MSVRTTDIVAGIEGAIDHAEDQIRGVVDTHSNDAAFKVLRADRYLRGERPFTAQGAWISRLENDISETADSVLLLRKTIEATISRQRMVVTEALRRAEKEILELEAAARSHGDVHPLHHPDTRAAVWSLTNGKCAYCEVELDPTGREYTSFCIEHVVPRSAGGPDNLANYVPSCHSCNSSKNGSHVLDFINRRFPNRQPAPAPDAAVPPAPRSTEAALAQFVEVAA